MPRDFPPLTELTGGVGPLKETLDFGDSEGSMFLCCILRGLEAPGGPASNGVNRWSGSA